MEGKINKNKNQGSSYKVFQEVDPVGSQKKLNCPTMFQTQWCAGETLANPLPMSLTWECQ
jgi:hypothetical protein